MDAHIRTLLTDISSEHLRLALYDHRTLKAVYDRIKPGMSQQRVINLAITYATQMDQLAELLTLAEVLTNADQLQPEDEVYIMKEAKKKAEGNEPPIPRPEKPPSWVEYMILLVFLKALRENRAHRPPSLISGGFLFKLCLLVLLILALIRFGLLELITPALFWVWHS